MEGQLAGPQLPSIEEFARRSALTAETEESKIASVCINPSGGIRALGKKTGDVKGNL
jgi:hypothetical protein